MKKVRKGEKVKEKIVELQNDEYTNNLNIT